MGRSVRADHAEPQTTVRAEPVEAPDPEPVEGSEPPSPPAPSHLAFDRFRPGHFDKLRANGWGGAFVLITRNHKQPFVLSLSKHPTLSPSKGRSHRPHRHPRTWPSTGSGQGTSTSSGRTDGEERSC